MHFSVTLKKEISKQYLVSIIIKHGTENLKYWASLNNKPFVLLKFFRHCNHLYSWSFSITVTKWLKNDLNETRDGWLRIFFLWKNGKWLMFVHSSSAIKSMVGISELLLSGEIPHLIYYKESSWKLNYIIIHYMNSLTWINSNGKRQYLEDKVLW